jgi:hypothetical protein
MMPWRWSLVVWVLGALAGCGDDPEPLALCEGVACSNHGVCRTDGFTASCDCDERYHAQGLACVLDSGGDADVDADADESPCPADMVYVASESFCIDRYEASHGASDTAASELGRIPWTQVTWSQASTACVRAGKELCGAVHRLLACGGPDEWDYPYGRNYDEGACVDQSTGLTEPLPAGSMPDCQGFYGGLFDMSGNVGEWTGEVQEGRGWIAVGSFYDDASRLVCNGYTPVPVGEHFGDVGFRCCIEL